jgi:1,2-diacylglycerol 3-beta-galactosyltransferase
MTQTPTPRKPHIVFYFSDTGGGHRSAAEAIIEAINIEYKNKATTEMVDIFKDYAPRPFNRVGDMYPYMVKAPQLWSASFHATDGRAQARAITATMWPLARHAAKTLVKMHPADLILVPTENARQRALKYKMPPEKVRVVGLPVADKYCKPKGRKNILRKKLGWTVDKPVVLLVGGRRGDGSAGENRAGNRRFRPRLEPGHRLRAESKAESGSRSI